MEEEAVSKLKEDLNKIYQHLEEYTNALNGMLDNVDISYSTCIEDIEKEQGKKLSGKKRKEFLKNLLAEKNPSFGKLLVELDLTLEAMGYELEDRLAKLEEIEDSLNDIESMQDEIEERKEQLGF